MIYTSNWRINRLIKLIPVMLTHFHFVFPLTGYCLLHQCAVLYFLKRGKYSFDYSISKKDKFYRTIYFHGAVIMIEIYSDIEEYARSLCGNFVCTSSSTSYMNEYAISSILFKVSL